jgi:hypothetical protein
MVESPDLMVFGWNRKGTEDKDRRGHLTVFEI